MFLSSESIQRAVMQGDFIISPFDENNLKAGSYMLTLESDCHLPPGAFVLGKTRETLQLKGKYLCLLGTRSSVAQQGIDVLQSSFIADAETDGQITLEIKNHGEKEVVLLAGSKIVKAVFAKLI